MGLNYSIAMLKNPQNQDESAKAYAKSQITGELSLKELSRRVAAQTTAVPPSPQLSALPWKT